MPPSLKKNETSKSKAREQAKEGFAFVPSPRAILPKECNPVLESLVKPHIDSFDTLLDDLDDVVQVLKPQIVSFLGKRVVIKIKKMLVGKPGTETLPLYPRECRERGITYGAPWDLSVAWEIPSEDIRQTLSVHVGDFPIMVKSKKCNLKGMNPPTLVSFKEDPSEVGGYFIVNGKERLVRLLLPQIRNYPIALRRAFKGVSSESTDCGVVIRSVRKDHTGNMMYLHYKRSGDIDVRFWVGSQSYILPVSLILKSLVETSDREIYEKVVYGNYFGKSMDISEEVLAMIQAGKANPHVKHPLNARSQCIDFLGQHFKYAMDFDPEKSNAQAGENFIEEIILPHLSNAKEKFELIIFMIQKLYALAKGKIDAESLDTLMTQEVLLPGHILLALLKARLQGTLKGAANRLKEVEKRKKSTTGENPTKAELHKLIFNALASSTTMLCQSFMNFLSTGNFKDSFAFGFKERSGYCIIAERINYFRYMSHFRAIHRGSSFQEGRITSTRKLLPETWGFLCPVHTPDGGPCGLLNHLATPCQVVTNRPDISAVPSVMTSLGMVPISTAGKSSAEYLPVFLSGKIIGKIPIQIAASVASKLRSLKTKDEIPSTTEIALILPSTLGVYPGLFLFADTARLVRPVKQLATGETELIGPFEQVYMDIACLDEDIRSGQTTHQEIHPTNIFSFIADLTPFSDFNQSPRNMYQCQMAKQTMAIPCHNYQHRPDKTFRIYTPQKPIVKTNAHDKYDFDDYPTGVNAVVAVISYTGYDMEDGMIINKNSYERGLAHGALYKMQTIELEDPRGKIPTSFVTNTNAQGKVVEHGLGEDGLPFVGQKLKEGDPFYSTANPSGTIAVKRYKGEEAVVDEVTILDNGHCGDTGGVTHATIKLRFNRNPVIGDKFSSRHGQKGTLSRLWPQIDMPFSESGMSPDIIINPNAFPSRMTIGMLVESLAGKSGALHAITQDGSPFRFNENDTAVQYFGDQLVKAGYNYYGNEPMYSGTTGVELKADIYLGVVYYQRLRHMVKDKFQARANIGPVSALHKQPLKGRKIGGGIRFGEMERDSIIGHGASFVLHDRLMNSSDSSRSYFCSSCGSFLSPLTDKKRVVCVLCDSGKAMEVVALPFVVRYLATELASVGIKLTCILE